MGLGCSYFGQWAGPLGATPGELGYAWVIWATPGLLRPAG